MALTGCPGNYVPKDGNDVATGRGKAWESCSKSGNDVATLALCNKELEWTVKTYTKSKNVYFISAIIGLSLLIQK